MDYAHKTRAPIEDVLDLLQRHHDQDVANLKPISGGYWSSAWRYDCGDQSLILRSAESDNGYRIDKAAYDFADAVPVPRVLHIGKGLGRYAAISEALPGSFLETCSTEELGDSLYELILALRTVPPQDSIEWPERVLNLPTAESWRDWLSARMQIPVSLEEKWRQACEENPEVEQVFARAKEYISSHLAAFPERRDLIHNDLLHQNVLVEKRRVTGIFSWKLSVFGDFLYDVAACSLWGPWFPSIESAQVFDRILHDGDVPASALQNAAVRHTCYQLHIGTHHLLWFVESDDIKNLHMLCAKLKSLLDVL